MINIISKLLEKIKNKSAIIAAVAILLATNPESLEAATPQKTSVQPKKNDDKVKKPVNSANNDDESYYIDPKKGRKSSDKPKALTQQELEKVKHMENQLIQKVKQTEAKETSYKIPEGTTDKDKDGRINLIKTQIIPDQLLLLRIIQGFSETSFYDGSRDYSGNLTSVDGLTYAVDDKEFPDYTKSPYPKKAKYIKTVRLFDDIHTTRDPKWEQKALQLLRSLTLKQKYLQNILYFAVPSAPIEYMLGKHAALNDPKITGQLFRVNFVPSWQCPQNGKMVSRRQKLGHPANRTLASTVGVGTSNKSGILKRDFWAYLLMRGHIKVSTLLELRVDGYTLLDLYVDSKINEHIKEVNNKIDDLNQKIKGKKAEINNLNKSLSKEPKNSKKRKDIKNNIKTLKNEINTINKQITKINKNKAVYTNPKLHRSGMPTQEAYVLVGVYERDDFNWKTLGLSNAANEKYKYTDNKEIINNIIEFAKKQSKSDQDNGIRNTVARQIAIDLVKNNLKLDDFIDTNNFESGFDGYQRILFRRLQLHTSKDVKQIQNLIDGAKYELNKTKNEQRKQILKQIIKEETEKIMKIHKGRTSDAIILKMLGDTKTYS